MELQHEIYFSKKNKMDTNLQTYWENIWTISNKRASAELALANLHEELHNTEIWKKILEKDAEVRQLKEEEASIKWGILAGMLQHGLKTVEFTNQRFTAKQNPVSVHILNEELIPQNYKKLKTELVVDKKAIKEAIQSGKDVEGAELTQGYTLVVTPR